MPPETPSPKTASDVSQELAKRILERAARLDADSADRVDLESLRAAAKEAGITDKAFERALTELTPPPGRLSPVRPVRIPKSVIVESALVGLAAGGIGIGFGSFFDLDTAYLISG